MSEELSLVLGIAAPPQVHSPSFVEVEEHSTSVEVLPHTLSAEVQPHTLSAQITDRISEAIISG